MAGLFVTERLNVIRFVYGVAMILGISALTLGVELLRAGVQAETYAHGSQPTVDSDWSELIAGMDKMHMAMGAVVRSGNSERNQRNLSAGVARRTPHPGFLGHLRLPN